MALIGITKTHLMVAQEGKRPVRHSTGHKKEGNMEVTFVGIEVVFPELGSDLKDFIHPIENASIPKKLKNQLRNLFWDGPIPLDMGVGLKLTGKPLSFDDCEFICAYMQERNKNWNEHNKPLILTYEM